MSAKVLCKYREEFYWITLNRPEKLNAMDAEVRELILSHLREAEGRGDVRVAVLRGAGKAFSAGADISHLKKLSEATSTLLDRPRGVWGAADIGR